MTLIKPIDDGTAVDENLAVAEQLFKEAGAILGDLLLRARQDDEEAISRLKTAVKELSDGWKMASMERNRVAEERKTQRGIVGDYAIDFDAARAEIGRRLDRLRAAGDG
ncbi:MAG: hypothetical protein QNJ16_19500 [Rhodobacter sp.]|nr:hypothetical protein [Rhodobacter sp.]